jgi:thymidylate synthase
MKILTETDIKKELRRKYQNKEFKFDKRTNQKFIEIVNAHFDSVTGFIVYHDHHVTDEQWYIDNYEPLLGDQIDNVIETIKNDPDTRQAYIGMLCPDKYQNGDKICTIGMQCIYRKQQKRLDYIVYMRSNNVCEYTQDSMWQVKIFTQIVNRLISEVDKEILPGHLYWNVGSLHLYEEDFKFLSDKTEIADELIYSEKICNRLGRNLLPISELLKVHFIDTEKIPIKKL